MRWLVLLLAGMLLAGAGTWRALEPGEGAPDGETDARALPTVSASEASPSDETMLGVVVPEQEVLLAPARFSKVVMVTATPGQRVTAGDVVAEMDTRLDRGELAAARAAARAARARSARSSVERSLATTAVSRAAQVTDYIAATELDELRSGVDAAEADQRAASASAQERAAQAQQISARIDDARLRAPFSGRVVQRFAEPGSVLGPGEPVLHLISDVLIVRFAVPEGRVGELSLGQPVVVEFSTLGLGVTAHVMAVSPEIETTARIVIAEAIIEPGVAELPRVGTIGRVRLGPPGPGLLVERATDGP